MAKYALVSTDDEESADLQFVDSPLEVMEMEKPDAIWANHVFRINREPFRWVPVREEENVEI